MSVALRIASWEVQSIYITAVETICLCLGKIASAADRYLAGRSAWAVRPTHQVHPLCILELQRQVPLRCDVSSARFVDAEAL